MHAVHTCTKGRLCKSGATSPCSEKHVGVPARSCTTCLWCRVHCMQVSSCAVEHLPANDVRSKLLGSAVNRAIHVHICRKAREKVFSEDWSPKHHLNNSPKCGKSTKLGHCSLNAHRSVLSTNTTARTKTEYCNDAIVLYHQMQTHLLYKHVVL